MVSFSCEECGDVLTKKKLDPHRGRCRGATFTCIDCMVYFPGVEYRSHTSCMTEDQKYQGALYKDKSKKAKNAKPEPQQQPSADNCAPAKKVKMGQQAYVEDIGDDRDYESWDEYEGATDDENSPMEPPPEAPTPPSAAANDDEVNVFDFLVNGQTPNASNMNLAHEQAAADADASQSTSLVRFERTEETILDPSAFLDEDGEDEPLVQYGTEPIPSKGAYVTPMNKSERRKKDSSATKDKKRKRLHVEVPGDQIMTDAPPVLHSGLTGGLKGLMRPTLPPSPDYSGADAAPASPLKKSKHSKHTKNATASTGIFGRLGSKSSSKKTKKSSKKSSKSKDHKSSPKLIEYTPDSKEGKVEETTGQMVVFKPRGDAFLSFVNKGPESERGCSMNKALKRFHRARQAAGSDLNKSKEEKELWRSLRLRRNERGEVVLFSEDLDLDEILAD